MDYYSDSRTAPEWFGAFFFFELIAGGVAIFTDSGWLMAIAGLPFIAGFLFTAYCLLLLPAILAKKLAVRLMTALLRHWGELK